MASAYGLKSFVRPVDVPDVGMVQRGQNFGFAATNPVVQRLTTAPGVGPLIAPAFVATLDEAGRFGGAHQVESYLGLVPSEHSSADRHRRGHITT